MSEACWQTPTQGIHFSDGHPLLNLLFVPNYLSSVTTVRPTEGSSVAINFLPNIYLLRLTTAADEGMVQAAGTTFSYNDNVSLTAFANNERISQVASCQKQHIQCRLGASSYDSTLSKITIDGRESPTIF